MITKDIALIIIGIVFALCVRFIYKTVSEPETYKDYIPELDDEEPKDRAEWITPKPKEEIETVTVEYYEEEEI